MTQDEDALEEFEQQKQEDLEGQVGKQVAKVEIKQGWGEWAGEGVDNS